MALDLLLKTLNDPLNPHESRQARLYRLLKEAILSGRLVPGTRLPGTRQLTVNNHVRRRADQGQHAAHQAGKGQRHHQAPRGHTDATGDTERDRNEDGDHAG